MAQPPSERDEDRGSLDDFATEGPVVQPRHADLESVVLWLTDRWRESTRVRAWFVGTLVLLIAGGAGLVWWATLPAAPSAPPPELIASSRVEKQPIEPPAIVRGLRSLSGSDRAVFVDRGALPIEKPAPAPRASSSRKAAEGGAAAASTASSAADRSQVSPPMPRPATTGAPNTSRPTPTSEGEPPPARAAVSEPAPAPPVSAPAPVSSSAATALESPRSRPEDTEKVAIQDVLGRYRSAFAALDVAGVHRVWPAVNQRSLERAFRQLEGQDLFFFSCDIDLDGVRAEAACVGTTNFVPKVGNRSPQSGPSQWNFKLSKRPSEGWLIDDAQAR